jgi:hypothetical protein
MKITYLAISLLLLTCAIHAILPEIPHEAADFITAHHHVSPAYTPKERTSYQQQRYNIIKKIASKYKRPITILEIGAMDGGYYTFNLAHDFEDAVCVMIEEDEHLQRLCEQNNTLNNIIFLQKHVTPQELKHLSECEHFDIVLALNVIHWAQDEWQEMADAILQLGDRIIVETPTHVHTRPLHAYFRDIDEYIQTHGGKQLLQIPHQIDSTIATHLYVITNPKNNIIRASWFDKPTNIYKIKSTLKEKTLAKAVICNDQKTVVERSWQPGINLLTFKMLNGMYPTVSMLQQSLLNLHEHNVWYKEPLMNNIIVQGARIQPIEATQQPCMHITNDFTAVLHYINQLLALHPDQVARLENIGS